MREQSVTARHVHHAAAAAPPAHAPRDLPGLVQLLARQAIHTAHDPPDAIEQRVAAETVQVVLCEPGVRSRREVHALWYGDRGPERLLVCISQITIGRSDVAAGKSRSNACCGQYSSS